MEFVREFFIINFPLFIIALGMVAIAIFDFRVKRRTSTYILAIIGSALLLAVFLELEAAGKANCNIPMVTIFSFFGYIFRPVVIFLFILLGDREFKKKRLWLLIPIGINILIHSMSLFIGTPMSRFVIYYVLGDDGLLHFQRGSIMGYSSHAISFFLLVLLTFISVSKIKTKHSADSFAILVCVVFVVIAVIIETFTDVVGLLNNAIGVSCVFYYLFMLNDANRLDALTGLFNRGTFYSDEQRFGKEVTCVIHIDVNNLKALNDNLGHEEGDKAIVTIAQIIKNNISRSMYAYRIGGDEYVVFCVNEDEEIILKLIKKMKQELSQTSYSASFGHGMRTNKEDTVDTLLKAAEQEMYADKELYYTTNKIDRRRR